MKDVIALMGIKHCGKTSLGRKIAEKWAKPFYDLDEELARLHGNNYTPREIYREFGAEVFRDMEYRAAQQILEALPAHTGSAIISLGGGIINNPAALNLLREHSYFIYLVEDPDILYERILQQGIPAFFNAHEDYYTQFLNLYHQRAAQYEQLADETIHLNGRTFTQALDYLMEQLTHKGYVR